MDDEILKTLLKKATGYSHDEVQEEFSVTPEGDMVLTKRKVTKKYYPPDSSALKTYLELASDRGLQDMSDEELEREKKRLLAELAETVSTGKALTGGQKSVAGKIQNKIGKPKGDSDVKNGK